MSGCRRVQPPQLSMGRGQDSFDLYDSRQYGLLDWTTRPTAVSGSSRFSGGRCGPRFRYSANARGMPSLEIIRAAPFSIRYSNPNLASQLRVTLAKMAWKTGSNSPVELEITCNTWEAAVCCSSDSLRSSVR